MNWMRVGAAALVTGACALLVACGSGSVVSSFDFQEGVQLRSDASSEKGRIMVVGDDFSDFGQEAGFVYSVRDDTLNWVQRLAGYYDVTIRTANEGGWGYAQGHARLDSPDTTSGSDAPSVTEQVDQLLSDAGGKLRKADLIFINGGMWDIIDAVESGGATETETQDAVLAAADVLVAQVNRLLKAGAGHVAVTGVYDLGTAPWASYSGGRADPKGSSALSELVLGRKNGDFPGFNGRLLTGLDNNGVTTQYLDAAQFFRFVYDADDDDYGITDDSRRKNPFCANPEAMLGCDAPSDSNYNTYLFADDIHFTPRIWQAFGHNDWGENAYQSVAEAWGEP